MVWHSYAINPLDCRALTGLSQIIAHPLRDTIRGMEDVHLRVFSVVSRLGASA